MNKRIKYTLATVFATLALTSCYEDKGNYDYTEAEQITGTGFPESMSVVQKSDYIELSPSFTSNLSGAIDNNPNYEFSCLLWKSGGTFSDTRTRQKEIDVDHAKDVKYFADLTEGNYVIQYMVTNKATGVTTNFKVPVSVTSATYEGWMVLCDDAEGYARMDMVSVLSATRKEAVHDILGTNAPKLRGARTMMMNAYPSNYYSGDCLWYSTNDGTYSLNASTLASAYNVAENEFIVTPKDEKVLITDGLYMGTRLCITDKGTIYCKSSSSGACYEDPINTFTDGGNQDFHAAPFIGVTMARPDYYNQKAILYDTDHQQFLSWDGSYYGNHNICSTIKDPENKLFSYKTGKDIVAMVNTKFSGSTIYSVLQDAVGQRTVYGINLTGGQIVQSLYEPVSAPGFDKATTFAFHSQYPYMFYNNGDKVYSYHLINHTANVGITLSDEEVTMVKFNLFYHAPGATFNKSDEFMAQQYMLIVGSYKKNNTDGNGGVLRFYKFDQATGSLTLTDTYEGFGKIKDVMYRER